MMTEYIEREAALKAFEPQCGDWSECWSAEEIKPKLESIPSADVVEVRHGQWVVSRTDFGWNCSEFPTHCKCTQCGREVPYQDRDNYCPNCGAKMDGGAQ